MGTPLYLLHAVTTAAISPFPHSAAVSTHFHSLMLPRRVTAAFAPHHSILPSFHSFFPSFKPFYLPSPPPSVRRNTSLFRNRSVRNRNRARGSKSNSKSRSNRTERIPAKRKATVDGRKRKGLKEGKGAPQGNGAEQTEARRTGRAKEPGREARSRAACASGGGTGVAWWVDGRTPYKN